MIEKKTHYKMYKSHKNWVIAGITVCGGILAAQNMNANIAKADSISNTQDNAAKANSSVTTASDLVNQSQSSSANNSSTGIKPAATNSNGINNNEEVKNVSVSIKSDSQNLHDNIDLSNSVNSSSVKDNSAKDNSANSNSTNNAAGELNADKSIVNSNAGDVASNKVAQDNSANVSDKSSANKVDEDTTANNQTKDTSALKSSANDNNQSVSSNTNVVNSNDKSSSNAISNKVSDNVYEAAKYSNSSDEAAKLSPNGDITDKNGVKTVSTSAAQPVSFAAINSNVKGLSFAAQVVPAKSLGVDVSGYQGTDMSGYARNGAKFAIVKVSEGTGYGNGNASGQIKSALANGMEVQAYHFARFGGSVSQADAEANHAIANAKYYGLPDGSYLACDYEADASGSVSNNTAAVEEFMKKIKDAGYTPLLYSGAYYMKQHLNLSDIVNKFGNCLWVASYPTTAAVSGPDFNYFPSMDGVIMWQYSDNWKGMSVDGDVNVIPLTGNQQGGQTNPQPSQPAQTGSASSNTSSNDNYKQDYKVGDKVTINKNASKWTNGATINHSVTDGQTYTVQQVATGDGGAVLLGASDGTTMGWVNDWDVSPVVANNTSNEPTWTDDLGDVWHKETGIFTVGDTPINLRWGATTSSTVITQLQPGDQVQYDAWMNDGTYTWIRQPRADGSYAYCAVREGNNAFGTFSDVPGDNNNNQANNQPANNNNSQPTNNDSHYTGQKQVDGKWQYWNNGQPVKNNYVWIPDEKKECYYDGNGNMVYGQQQIWGHWQYFDPTTGAQVKNNYVWLPDDKKEVYYDGNGNMVYGQQQINGHWQYFDPTTGAQVKNNYVWLPDDKKEVYYDGNGNMVYGWQNIWGHKVYFDPTTGAQYKNCDKEIDGQEWHFDDQGIATLVQQPTTNNSSNNSQPSNTTTNNSNANNSQPSNNTPAQNTNNSNSSQNSPQIGGTNSTPSSSDDSSNKVVNNSNGTTGIATTNKNNQTATNVNNGSITVQPTISYKGLTPGNKYNVTIQETDPSGKVVGTATFTFTPTSSDGDVKATMDIKDVPSNYNFMVLTPRIASIAEVGNDSSSITNGTTDVTPNGNSGEVVNTGSNGEVTTNTSKGNDNITNNDNSSNSSNSSSSTTNSNSGITNNSSSSTMGGNEVTNGSNNANSNEGNLNNVNSSSNSGANNEVSNSNNVVGDNNSSNANSNITNGTNNEEANSSTNNSATNGTSDKASSNGTISNDTNANIAGDVNADKSTAKDLANNSNAKENQAVNSEELNSKDQVANNKAAEINASKSTTNNTNELSNSEDNDQHYMGEELDKSKLVESAQEDYIKNQQKANENNEAINSQIGSPSNISNENSNVIPQTGEANNNDKEKGMIMLASAGLIGMLGAATSIKKKED